MMLADKVMVVTGAGRGIGRAIAHAAAGAGAKVVVVDNGCAIDGSDGEADLAERVCAEITAAGGEAIAACEDVTDVAAAGRAVERAFDAWGRIDALVNNAGMIRAGDFPEPDPAAFEAQIRVNLYGAFNMAHAAAPRFKAQESGAFIHMTSSVGLIGSPHLPGYAASKFAVAGLSRTLSFDMAKFNVRSNCIAPSAPTRITESTDDSPDQVAPLVLFLASSAAGGVTGQIFGTRGDAIFLYSQPRPIRIAQRGAGWTAETIARDVLPGWRSSLVPHETPSDVIP